jgi:hypothetical protein
MAANEHKNLTDVNRHNPKGFENALNSTVLCKTAGTGEAQQDGTLNWQSKNVMGSVDYTITGYLLSGDHENSNFYRPAHMTDGQSPNQYNADTGQTVATNISVNGQGLITRAAKYIVDSNSTVYKIYGWLNSSGTDTVTLTIAKVTPTANSTSVYSPVIIDEISVTGLGSAMKLIEINETSITSASLSKGDFLMAFIKDSGGGSNNIYWQVKVCTTKY